MAEKKKSPLSKSTDRKVSRPTVSKTAKLPDGEAAAPASRAGSAAAAQPAGPAEQLSRFEGAMKLFHARQFREARDLFRQAAEGPERDVAHRAQLHAAMCDRRLEQATVNLRSAEDYYNYGVALLNTRNATEARSHLEKALEMAPGSDHIHYALALAQALGGDVSAAHENLKRAIELEPRNRIMARQDADFAPLANQPPFDSLLYPEKKSW